MPSFNIFLPKELYDKALTDAKAKGISLSRWIRTIVEEYYAKKEGYRVGSSLGKGY